MADEHDRDGEMVAELYRCALLLYGRREEALASVVAALKGLVGKPEAGEPERAERFLFGKICRGAPKKVEGGEGAVVVALQALPAGERSVAALYYATGLEAEDIVRVLGISSGELGKILFRVRQKLARSDAFKARGRKEPAKLLPLEVSFFRGGEEGEKVVQEALREEVAVQREIDTECKGALAGFVLGEEDREKQVALLVQAEQSGTVSGLSLRDPGVWGLIAGAFLLIGLLVWLFFGGGAGIDGKREIVRILESNKVASAAEYEPVESDFGEMDDWFALKGIEGIWFPVGMEKLKTVAVRVFPVEGVPVATVLLPEEKMFVSFFDGDRLGVSVRPENSWQMLQCGSDAVAIQQRGKLCLFVAVPGSVQDLSLFLGRLTEGK